MSHCYTVLIVPCLCVARMAKHGETSGAFFSLSCVKRKNESPSNAPWQPAAASNRSAVATTSGCHPLGLRLLLLPLAGTQQSPSAHGRWRPLRLCCVAVEPSQGLTASRLFSTWSFNEVEGWIKPNSAWM